MSDASTCDPPLLAVHQPPNEYPVRLASGSSPYASPATYTFVCPAGAPPFPLNATVCRLPFVTAVPLASSASALPAPCTHSPAASAAAATVRTNLYHPLFIVLLRWPCAIHRQRAIRPTPSAPPHRGEKPFARPSGRQSQRIPSLPTSQAPISPLPGGKHPWVLANPVAHLQKASFPMIGKYFSNGWKNDPIFPMIGKIFRAFSNDWKKYSGEEIRPTGGTREGRGRNFSHKEHKGHKGGGKERGRESTGTGSGLCETRRGGARRGRRRRVSCRGGGCWRRGSPSGRPSPRRPGRRRCICRCPGAGRVRRWLW